MNILNKYLLRILYFIKLSLFFILLEYYNKWIKADRKINYSKNFTNQTNEYLVENDPFSPFYEKFISDRIVQPSKN